MVNDISSAVPNPQQATENWLRGGGGMGDLVRAYDWSTTPLGPMEAWPQSLRTAVSLCLSSTFPMNIIWGSGSTQIYNDGYRVVCGDVHPRALGEDYRVTWASAWPAIGDSFDRAWAGERMFLENQRMFLKRLDGKLEETFFTFSHSPIQDESGQVGGLFHPVTETTGTMLAERRTRALRDLAGRLAGATDEPDVARRTIEVLAHFQFDLPFLLYYRLDMATMSYRLSAHHGIRVDTAATPLEIAPDDVKPWAFASALAAPSIVDLEDLPSILNGLPCGPYEEPPCRGFIIPIVVPAAEQAPAVIVAGASSRLPLNADYRSFYDLLGVTIAGALATVRAREDERRRAEALAEIDRAKTAFFSNVSHEFRTPLTLMLGPLDETLARSETLSPADREQLATVQRNSLRLLKLVNTLLDFSRIEAGRVQAVYEPTDLARVTAELASVFRSAIEKAGLALIVDCPPLSEPAYVDREMWEKIVLNLLSNAFKFTFEGQIEVRLAQSAGHATLAVRDTGTGIPADELPRLFERFHRVAGAHGRTHEGSGIGLALVQELVKLHGGSVGVESVLGRGTEFAISIPLGRAHLPPGQIGGSRRQASTALGATPFVEEALRWLPEADLNSTHVIRDLETAARAEEGERESARILLADDNADMRDYVRRLLAPRYEVKAVADGEAALHEIARELPDLVLSDIMMPRLDGMQLLARLRADRRTRTVPIILLSARAGEESRVEGMEAGADDYLIKPFSARELLARVEAHLKMARERNDFTEALRASEERFRNMADHAPVMIWVTEPDGACSFLSQSWYEFTGQTPRTGLGFGWLDAAHPEDRQSVQKVFVAANDKHEAFRLEYRLRRRDGTYRWAIDAASPRFGANGEFLGYIGSVIDITERKQAEETQRLLVSELNHRVKNTLANVQAIAQHTLRQTRDPGAFVESFSGRIQSLARVHSMLTATTWSGADLRDLIRDQLLQGSTDETRISVSGPPVRLEAQMTLHLALVLHELGTNAHKYGALSAPAGRIAIRWTVEDRSLRLRWEERGGPPMASPMRRGFGTKLIDQSVRTEGGVARMSAATEGIFWDITLPLRRRDAADTDSTPPNAIGGNTDIQHGAAPTPRRLTGKRFLVVEDEPLVALDITVSLEDAGAEVVASTGSPMEALQVIERQALDAAFLDGNLNGHPVDDIAAALARREVPFLFLTGYGREALPPAFGHIALLAKPFAQNQLTEAAIQLIDRNGASTND